MEIKMLKTQVCANNVIGKHSAEHPIDVDFTIPDYCGEIERILNTVFRPSVWTKFVKAVKEFKMINAGDKIAVCISGGKDSMLLAKLMQMLQKISDVPFEIEYISMDP